MHSKTRLCEDGKYLDRLSFRFWTVPQISTATRSQYFCPKYAQSPSGCVENILAPGDLRRGPVALPACGWARIQKPFPVGEGQTVLVRPGHVNRIIFASRSVSCFLAIGGRVRYRARCSQPKGGVYLPKRQMSSRSLIP